jgi:hypothetical protein
MARSQELRQEAQAMSNIEQALAKVEPLPLRAQVRVLGYAVDAALDAQKAAQDKLDAEAGDAG